MGRREYRETFKMVVGSERIFMLTRRLGGFLVQHTSEPHETGYEAKGLENAGSRPAR